MGPWLRCTWVIDPSLRRTRDLGDPRYRRDCYLNPLGCHLAPRAADGCCLSPPPESDQTWIAVGIHGRQGTRNAPTLLNRAWGGSERFHNTGVAWQPATLPDGAGALRDQGRARVTGRERDRGAFKTPTLREVARTAPYMHDGSLRTLEDVIEFYDGGGRPNPQIDPVIRPLALTATEKRQLAAFLHALTGAVVDGVRASR